MSAWEAGGVRGRGGCQEWSDGVIRGQGTSCVVMRGHGRDQLALVLERPHQGIDNRPAAPKKREPRPGGLTEVHVRERLGGLLRAYCRSAA